MTALSGQIERPATIDVLEPDGPTTSVVIVLQGGKVKSFEPTDRSQLTAVRMRPFASTIHRGGRAHGVAVWTVRYRYRGWNGDDRSPVVDVTWALDEVRRRHGEVDVVLVGHSMGGRTALFVGGHPLLAGICALAPWCEQADPVDQLAGKTVLIAHGSIDTVTSPRASRRFAKRASQAGAAVGYIVVRGDIHAMVFRWRTWHRLAAGFALGTLGISPMPRRLKEALEAE
jgi:predicted esterase